MTPVSRSDRSSRIAFVVTVGVTWVSGWLIWSVAWLVLGIPGMAVVGTIFIIGLWRLRRSSRVSVAAIVVGALLSLPPLFFFTALSVFAPEMH